MTADLAIVGATVVDGSGRPATVADVLISGDRVEAVNSPAESHGSRRVVDAAGLTLAPGFIDVHSHADNAPLLQEDDTSKILQGVTTEVVGNCGFSLAPRAPGHEDLLARFSQRIFPPVDWTGSSFADFLLEADEHRYVVNYAPLVGHGTLRVAIMGMANRPPSSREQAEMGQLLERSLAEGAFGLSSGLIYPPGLFSQTEELIELASHLPGDSLYATHMRGEGDRLEESVAEAIRIGQEARCRVQISHHKAAGRENWGKTVRTLAALETARTRGLEIDQDVYPYTAASTMLTTVLPPSFQDGGDEEVLRRLQDADSLEELRRAIEHGIEGWENHIAGAGWDGILISTTASHQFEGSTLAQLSHELRLEPLAALVHVLVQERLRVSMVVFSMHEEDVERVLADGHTMIGSDGLPPGMGGKPHPRLFGTFPRVLRRYVKERGVLTLEEAVKRMTSMPAAKFRIPRRGSIAAGQAADVVAFDAAEVTDVGDYTDPVHPPQGIRWVMQAGELVVEAGRWLGTRRGTRLTPPRHRQLC